MGFIDLELGENCIHLRQDRNKWRAVKNDNVSDFHNWRDIPWLAEGKWDSQQWCCPTKLYITRKNQKTITIGE
jgi:hypothetical protein